MTTETRRSGGGRPMGVEEEKPRTNGALIAKARKGRSRKAYAEAAKVIAERRRGRHRPYWRTTNAPRNDIHDAVEKLLKKLKCLRCEAKALTLGEINEEEMTGSARCRDCDLLYNWEKRIARDELRVWSTIHKRGGLPVEIGARNGR